MLYPIAIIQREGQYHGRFPDLPELEVTANSMANIISNARRELITYLLNITENDESIPEGSDVGSYLAKDEFAGWTWAIVKIDAARIIGEAVELNLTIPERLMQKIAKYTTDNDLDIEEFFIQLIKNHFDATKK